MRFPKGSIQLSEQQDLPLLKEVLRCGFVSHAQLYDLLSLAGSERRRECFNWRVRRLAEHGLLRRDALPDVASRVVYSLTVEGVQQLVGVWQSTPGAVAAFERKHDSSRIIHALDLNDIRLALARAGLLVEWTSEIEIRARNEFTNYGYAKDYDAVVKVRTDGGQFQFGLEYERNPKANRRYLSIRSAMQSERRLDRFLYLVPDFNLLWFLREVFGRSSVRVYFGIACDFRRSLLATQVVDPNMNFTTLADALRR